MCIFCLVRLKYSGNERRWNNRHLIDPESRVSLVATGRIQNEVSILLSRWLSSHPRWQNTFRRALVRAFRILMQFWLWIWKGEALSFSRVSRRETDLRLRAWTRFDVRKGGEWAELLGFIIARSEFQLCAKQDIIKSDVLKTEATTNIILRASAQNENTFYVFSSYFIDEKNKFYRSIK